ncbi:cilia- and flagella-associated protein 45-like [Latimeria chalumnae]|uniref:cilia- and flagella-associated protein 45-like n=1 Tax=Latimeria chalumnae TaxID=7897 RepID=UPI00313F3C17
MVPGVNKRRAAGRELQPRSSVPRLAFFKQEAKDSRSSQMPSSDVSSGSSVSVHSKSRRYRTKALNSEVDETLFGSAVKKLNTVKEDDASEKEGPRQGKAASAPAGGQKEIIRIITKDLIRSLIVPTEDPSGKSVIITPQEYNRIRSAARFLTKEEREVAMQKMKEEKAEILTTNPGSTFEDCSFWSHVRTQASSVLTDLTPPMFLPSTDLFYVSKTVDRRQCYHS